MIIKIFIKLRIFGAPGSKILRVRISQQVEPHLLGKESNIKSVHGIVCEAKKPTAELCTLKIVTCFQFPKSRTPIRIKL